MATPPPTSTTGLPVGQSSSTPLSSSSLPPPAPKILLAKPGGSGPAGAKFPREDDSVVLRPRAASISSLNLLSSDSWEFHIDRALPFLTENTDFTVIGVIGPPGVGKSTILNELYGFDVSSPGMLPPFATQSEEIKAMAKHCTVGIEMRVSAERLVLLDTQPIFSPSVLTEMMRPDGSSAVPVLNGEPLPADLAHELMGIQLGVFLSSVCHILLVVSEGVHDTSTWHLMLTVDLLKHGIPDPSMLTSGNSSSNLEPDKEIKDNLLSTGKEFLAAPVFVHSRLRDHDLSPSSVMMLRKGIQRYFGVSSLCRSKRKELVGSSESLDETSKLGSAGPDLFVLPLKVLDDLQRPQYESYGSMLGKLRDQILSMKPDPFGKPVSERDWVRNSFKIWDMVKRSPIIMDYCRTLQNSGIFRK